MTATDVNHILGKLYTAVAQNRVLTSVGGIKSEFKFSYKFEQWKEMSRNATPLSPPQSIQAPPYRRSGCQSAYRSRRKSRRRITNQQRFRSTGSALHN